MAEAKRLLVVFGSVEGQTRKIARAVSACAQAEGWRADVFDMADLADADPAAADAVLVAVPVHAGRFPEPVAEWVKLHAARLGAMPGAFVSVSLSAASSFPEEKAAIEKIAADFLNGCGWQPRALHHAAGALRYTSYDFLKRLLMRYIAAREGASTDTGKDQEFTDWPALERFVADFLAAA